MKAKIIKCPNKEYWYSGLVGEVIELTGEKWVEDGLHQRRFVPGVDNGVPISQIDYSVPGGRYVRAVDIEIMEG